MCTNFFPNPSGQVVHNRHLVLRGKTPPKLVIIFERYWFPNLTPTFEQLMGPPPKQTNLTNNPTCLEHEVFICYFGPHGSGHHPTLVDTLHSHRLPPSESQTQLQY
jgi:hypothetical protein